MSLLYSFSKCTTLHVRHESQNGGGAMIRQKLPYFNGAYLWVGGIRQKKSEQMS